MSFRSYILLMLLATLLAWGGWAYVLVTVDPFQAGILGLVLFYVTMFFGTTGSVTLLELLVRLGILRRQDLLVREVKTSFRHAILLSTVAVVSLLASAFAPIGSSARWWILFVLIFVAVGIEYMFLIVQRAHRG